MDAGQIFKIITNSTLLATRLLPSNPPGPVSFEEVRYCTIVPENAPLSSGIAKVSASHTADLPVQYTITGGNRDGLFTIDRRTGFISLAAHLDYEFSDRHLLEVSATSEKHKVRTSLHVLVADVNDSPPIFEKFKSKVTVIEEDDRNLPRILTKVSASDPDLMDQNSLSYSVEGEGVSRDTPGGPIFSINPTTGEVLLLRAVDRDPPLGRSIYKIKVIVRDGSNKEQMNKNERENNRKIFNVGRARRKTDESETIKNFHNNNNRRFEPKRQKKLRTIINENKSSNVLNRLDDTPISMQTEMMAGVDGTVSANHSLAISNDLHLSKGFLPSFEAPLSDSNGRGESLSPPFLESRLTTPLLSESKLNESWKNQQFWLLSKRNFMRHQEATECAEDVLNGSKCHRKTKKKTTNEISNEIEKRDNEKGPEVIIHEKDEFHETFKRFKNENVNQQSNGIKTSGEINCLNKNETGLKNSFFFIKEQKHKKCYSSFSIKIVETYCEKCDGENLKKCKGNKDGFQNVLLNIRNLHEVVETNFKSFTNFGKNRVSKESISKSLKCLIISEKISNYMSIFAGKCFERYYLEDENVCFCLSEKIYLLLRKIYFSSLENKFFLWNSTESFSFNFPSFESFLIDHFFHVILSNEVTSKPTNKEADTHKGKRSFDFTLCQNENSVRMRKVKVSKVLENDINGKIVTRNVGKTLHLSLNSSAKRSIPNWSKDFFTSNEVDRSQKIKSEHSSQTDPRSSTERNESLDFDQDPLPSLSETGSTLMDPQTFSTDPKNENILDNFRSIFHSPEEEASRFGAWKGEANKNGMGEIDKNALKNSSLYLADRTSRRRVSVIYHGQEFLLAFNSTKRLTSQGFRIPESHKKDKGNFKLDFSDISLLENVNKEYNLVSDILDSGNDVKRVERHTSKEGEKLEDERRSEKYFCAITDPRVKMAKHEGSYGIQFEPLSDKELEPFMSRIYMETNDQHEVSVVITIIVKDINDNVPIFPNSTMYGEVQENGPIDLPVTTVTAWDADDATSGTNARLTYSLEKNVVDEKTGEALFSIHPRTGELRTALCCLDRETTPEYRVQVVASDGGGLKGSGTVIVRLADVNDNSPRLARDEWNVVVDETFGDDDPSDDTLIEISVTDPDVSNYFFYRIVESSGKGWDYFGIRTIGSVGELYAKKSLDYENKDQKNGFRFDVQVTDRGPGGWNDSRHVDLAHVNIVLRDVNDNDPIFQTKDMRVTVKEDVPVDTLLAKLSAQDKDEGLNGQVDYHIIDVWENLRVDEDGGVRVWRHLDREGAGGDKGVVRVVAMDRGTPKRSTTATLTVTLQDVNDCSPRLLPPHILHVSENSPPLEIGVLKATDDDIWSEGNGPPFEFSLANSNPEDILNKISLTFDSSLDSGRGGARLWTRKPLDREEHRSLTVEIAVGDSRGLMTSQPVYVVIDDMNDNKMKPGSKMVYLWKTKDMGLDASLGRIYVEDPDDWDLKDKFFEWIGAPHPLFSLDKETGTLFASGQIREGRYDLMFSVSDLAWKQHLVQGNVTVIVHLLSQDALTHAVPLSLSLTSPTELTRDWNPLGGGGTLGALLDAVKENIDARRGSAMVVSVYGTSEEEKNGLPKQMGGRYDPPSISFDGASTRTLMEKTHVWISFQEEDLSFMNPIKLRGILEMNIYKIRKETNLLVNLEAKSRKIMSFSSSSLDSTSSTSINYPNHPMFPPHYLPQWSNTSSASNQFPNPSAGYTSATSLASTALPLQVVDNNSTSFVSPRLLQSSECSSPNSNFFKKSDECLPDSCLNGGKCVSSELGKRCVCPGGTLEPFCKISSRGFGKGGWAWINPTPLCAPTTISLKFLTAKTEGVILYSGPLTSKRAEEGVKMTSETTVTKRQKYPNKFLNFDDSQSFNWEHFGSSPYSLSDDVDNYSLNRKASPLLALYLLEGRMHLSLEGSRESAHLILNTTDALNDGKWHTIHLLLDDKKVKLIVDYCIAKSVKSTEAEVERNCSVNHIWSSEGNSGTFWGSHGPLQIGGLAQRTPKMEEHRWGSQPVGSSMEGCISELRIGGELKDLGAPAYSYHSHPGCEIQKNACIPRCAARAVCAGGLGVDAYCECPPGITGINCDRHPVPVSLESQSFAKVALSFTPDTFSLFFQLRLRTRTKDAAVLFLSSQESKQALVLKLRNGVVSFSLVDLKSTSGYLNRVHQKNTSFGKPQLAGEPNIPSMSSHSTLLTVSLEEIRVNDGRWHTIKGGKYGNNLLLEVDNGDLGKRNETLLLEEATKGREFRTHSGGLHSLEFKLDVREGVTIGGIPHFANRALTHVEDDLSESCLDDIRIQGKQVPLPLVLNETKWGQVTTFRRFKTKCIAHDSCKGKTCKSPLVCRDEWRQGSCRCPPGEQLTNGGCQEMDMCLFGPCLNGGSCIQDKTGMSCLCKPHFSGQNCEWEVGTKDFASLLNPIVLTVSILVLVFLTLFVIICCVKFHLNLRKRKRKENQEESGERDTNSPENRESGELEIFYIYDRSGKQEKIIKKRNEQVVESTAAPITIKQEESQMEMSAQIQVAEVKGIEGCNLAVCQDDLRAYAYEGESSSTGSLTSALSGQQRPPSRSRYGVNDASSGSSFERCYRFTEESPGLLSATPRALKAASVFVKT